MSLAIVSLVSKAVYESKGKAELKRALSDSFKKSEDMEKTV